MTRSRKSPLLIRIFLEKILIPLSSKVSLIQSMLIFSFMILTLISKGQNSPKEFLPAYFIDSVLVKKLPVFDLDRIENINIFKYLNCDEIPNTRGRIYINIKKPGNELILLTLEQIAEKWGKSNRPYLYMLNDEIVKNTQDVKVDSFYILKCEIVESNEILYLSDMPSFTILNIITRTKANLKKEEERLKNEKEIRIRGTE